MASPSEHKEGLRCGWRKLGSLGRGGPFYYEFTPHFHECEGLLLEQDSEQGLGVRCYKKGCRKFHPLEVLLSQAMEQGLLSPEQREAIRRAIAEEDKEKLENRSEEEMTTATKHSIEIDPPVHAAIDPAGAIDAMRALEEKREHIYKELIKRHFPTADHLGIYFDSGELKSRASKFINILARGNVAKVEIEIVVDDRHKYATWLAISFLDGKLERFQDSGWSMLEIARDAAYRFQAFCNLLGVEVVLRDETRTC
ncbi:MAG: hypothetical protein WAP23_02905 [Candidatus Spechtbacterales bacterium]